MENVYAQLKEGDYIKFLQTEIDKGALKWSNDYPNKLEPLTRGTIDSPWVNVMPDSGHRTHCMFNQMILFNQVSKCLPQRFVPSFCQECWKVVNRPETLKQLWAICDLQSEMGKQSKCGIEERKEVFGIYGAYWYTRSLEEGKELHGLLKGKPALKQTPLILKRGCSEMEWACGDSSKWRVYENQLEIEEAFRNLIVMEKLAPVPQTDWVVRNVKRRWIEWAWEHGDKTVFEFNGGQPLIPPYRTYH